MISYPSMASRRASTRGTYGRPACSLVWMLHVAAVVLSTGCGGDPTHALGTLEYDRVTVPAPASERITEVRVREGDLVDAGTVLLRLDPTTVAARYDAALADAERQRRVLDEARAGPRRETIAAARAELAAARADAQNRETYHRRVSILGARGVVAPAEVDDARAAAESARGRVRAAAARLTELRRGTRTEEIAQAQAAFEAAAERGRAQGALLAKLTVTAPRRGRIDSLPYRLGDQPPEGAPVVVMVTGERPHARVYVPEPVRSSIAVGTEARVYVGDAREPLGGRVRTIRSEPSFTPYYALVGEDAARLSYLAEVELSDPGARELPAGVPARVEFLGSSTDEVA